MPLPITTTKLIARQLGVGLFFILILGVVVYYYQEEFRGLLRGLPNPERVLKETFIDSRVARPLDGVLVDEVASSTIFAVILDNAPEAWPHYGLVEAQVVWEFPVEGGRTRLMALYDGSVIGDTRIGPVRSARPYFLDIAQSYDAYVVHVGGSPDALNMIAQGYVDSLNEFSAGSYFWRDRNRYAPHNAMTDGEELLDAVSDRDIAASTFDGWSFDDVASSEDVAPSWDFGELSVEWRWEGDSYVRYVGGEPFVDASGETIRADNVVLVFTPMRVVDGALRREIVTVGEGEVVAFIAGNKIEGAWSRDEGGVMQFFNEEGEEVVFDRGVTWVEVLPAGWKILTTVSD